MYTCAIVYIHMLVYVHVDACNIHVHVVRIVHDVSVYICCMEVFFSSSQMPASLSPT